MKVIKSYPLLLAALFDLIGTLCSVATLKVPAMIVHYVATIYVLGTEFFPQHNTADLNSGITFIVLFSQEKSLR